MDKIKLYFVEKFTEGDTDAQLEAMRAYFDFVTLEEADVIYCASIVQYHKAVTAQSMSQKPIATYCWDYYLWAHEGRHHDGSDWKKYAQFLQSANMVFVPSRAQQYRLKELLDVDSIVVHTGILTYDQATADGGYVLDPVRYYPVEEAHWVEKACKELGIPCIHSEHGYSQEEFRKLVSNCTFMTCAYSEASTGGLSLMEGLWNGKPSLVSDSPYMGAKDYLRQFGFYYIHGNYEDLKKMIGELWENRPIVVGQKKYISDNFSFDAMARNLYDSMLSLKKNL